jgi:predicted neuraminidase
MIKGYEMLELVWKQDIQKPEGTEFVHASTLSFLPDGGYALACFGGSREGNRDVRIFHTRTDSKRFLPLKMIESSFDEAHWNPVLFSNSDSDLMLFYKVGAEIRSWRTMVRHSKDLGSTYSQPRELVPGDFGGRGPVRNKPVRLSDGSILAPGSLERDEWTAFADRSEDNGSTWSKSNDIRAKELVQIGAASLSIEHVDSKIPVSEQSFHGRGIIQPTLWESSPGTVHMLLRSTENRVYRSDSTDFGRTWSTAYPIELPNNNSGIDLTRIRGGHLLLVYNPVGKNWGARTPLAVAVSSDNGSSWEQLLVLEAGLGEYSYPAIISQNDTVIISYTADRRGITVCQFKIL